MHVSEQSRANDSSNWRRRDDGAAPPPASTSSWSRPRKDNRPNDANGRSTAAYPARTHHVEKNGEDIDYSKRIYLGEKLLLYA